MRIQPPKNIPVGALSRKDVEDLGRKPGSIIYKVYSNSAGLIRKMVVDKMHPHNNSFYISGGPESDEHTIGMALGNWYGKGPQYGYLFSNYMHALAYSLKCRNKEGS